MFGGLTKCGSRLVERAAKPADGFSTRVVPAHAARDELIDARRDERLELVVDLVARVTRVAERQPEPSPHAVANAGSSAIRARHDDASRFLAPRIVTSASKWSTIFADSARRYARPAVVRL